MSSTQISTNTTTTMSTVEIAELTSKDHKNVLADTRTMFKQLGLDVLNFQQIYLDNYNRKQTCYHLPYRETQILVTGYSVQHRAKVIDRWLELEQQNKNKSSFTLPTTYKQALIALVESEEEKERLALERDHAIKTKALISDKKTATALANSGHKTKIINKLNAELDDAKEAINIYKEYIDTLDMYSSILAVEIKLNQVGQNLYKWQDLKRYSVGNRYEIKSIPDSRFGTVKAYHKDVWASVYNVSI